MNSRGGRSRVKQVDGKWRPGSTGLPVGLVIPAVVAALFLGLPAVALLVRAPWRRLGSIYSGKAFRDALWLSLQSSVEATVLALLFGVPLAFLLARGRVRGLAMVRAVAILPLVLPPVVGGVALFYALGRKGLIGQYLDSWFGFTLPFSEHGIVLAQTFVAMPFLIVTVEGGIRSVDRGLEEAAATLGASPWRVFAFVTLRLIAPSLAAGTVLCWARAFGEFGATLLFGGNVPGQTQTLPTLDLERFQNQPVDAVAVSLPLMAVTVVVLVGLRDSWFRTGATV